MGRFRLGIIVLAFALQMQGCRSAERTPETSALPTCLPAQITITENGINLENRSTFQWTRIRMQVNETDNSGGFRANIPSLNAGENQTVPFSNLLRDDGLRFDLKSYAVDHVSFHSDQGGYNQFGCDKEFTHSYIEKLKGNSN